MSQLLFNVWSDFGQGTDNCLNRTQLEIVCERVGLRKVGKKVAGEVFEKLGLSPNNRIGYNEFIALLHSDSDIPTFEQCPIITSTDTNSVGTLEDSTGYDLHAHSGLFWNKKKKLKKISSFPSSFFFFFSIFFCFLFLFVFYVCPPLTTYSVIVLTALLLLNLRNVVL